MTKTQRRGTHRRAKEQEREDRMEPRKAILKLRTRNKELESQLNQLNLLLTEANYRLEEITLNSFTCRRCHTTILNTPPAELHGPNKVPICAGCKGNAELLASLRNRNAELTKARQKIAMTGGTKTHLLITKLIDFLSNTLTHPGIPPAARRDLEELGRDILVEYRRLLGHETRGGIMVAPNDASTSALPLTPEQIKKMEELEG
jgi:hypothetical protein